MVSIPHSAAADMLAALKAIAASFDALDYLSEGNPIRAGYLQLYRQHGEAVAAAIAKAEKAESAAIPPGVAPSGKKAG
jgi:hypothetical protein